MVSCGIALFLNIQRRRIGQDLVRKWIESEDIIQFYMTNINNESRCGALHLRRLLEYMRAGQRIGRAKIGTQPARLPIKLRPGVYVRGGPMPKTAEVAACSSTTRYEHDATVPCTTVVVTVFPSVCFRCIHRPGLAPHGHAWQGCESRFDHAWTGMSNMI